MTSLLDFLKTNQVATLLLGGSAITGVIYYLKSIPGKLWNLFLWKYTSTVSITNDDAIFAEVSDWLSQQEFSKDARHLRCDTGVDADTKMTKVRLCPGLGGAYFWYKGKPFLLNRTQSGNQSISGKPTETITLQTIGSSTAIRQLITEVQLFADSKTDYVDVYEYYYGWDRMARKGKRPLSTVVMPEEQSQRIVSDIEHFISSEEWYTKMGIPYRRGLLFTGAPGTGKTSLVLALAAHFNLRIYAVSLNSIKDDATLTRAVTTLPERSLLLIEDVDAVSSDRDDEDEKEVDIGVSLAGLLNSIDGVFSRDGRVLVMTTNYPERLDSALTRPGRIDLIENIGPLQSPEIERMSVQFLGDSGAEFAKQFNEPIAASKLQQLLIQERNK